MWFIHYWELWARDGIKFEFHAWNNRSVKFEFHVPQWKLQILISHSRPSDLVREPEAEKDEIIRSSFFFQKSMQKFLIIKITVRLGKDKC